MASRDPAGSLRLRSRRSIAHAAPPKRSAEIDKGNITADISAMHPSGKIGKAASKHKKSRSKSLGIGGLDALQDSTGNRRKSTVVFPLKSILKPTIPVSPLRPIPSFDETRKQASSRSPSRAQFKGDKHCPNSKVQEGMLIDVTTPTRIPAATTDRLANPFDGFNASSVIRDAKEREERERREREKHAILEQREARRKSMANRRVSFAPEATLHTWNVVELAEDSTLSSSSNSTMRASSLADSTSQGSAHEPGPLESPSTERPTDPDASFSPVRHGDLHRKNKYMRPTVDATGDLSSSPYSGSSVTGSEDIEIQGPVKEDVGNQNQDELVNDFDGEITSVSIGDISGRTTVTTNSDTSSTSSSGRLDEALRQAAQEAGTRLISYDETGECSMEIADQEITGAFQPWIKKGERRSFDMEDLSALHDQENIDLFPLPSGNNNAGQLNGNNDDSDNEDLSMEVTNAIGHILSNSPNHYLNSNRRKSSGEETNYDEKTMEFTKIEGGITEQAPPAKFIDADSNIKNEEMTMESKSAPGSVLYKNFKTSREDAPSYSLSVQPLGSNNRNFSEWGSDEDDPGEADMEFTGAVGGILPPIEEQIEPQEEETAGMDMTSVMSRIFPSSFTSHHEQQVKEFTGGSDGGQVLSSPFQESVPPSPPKMSPSYYLAPIVSENGSPSLASVRPRRTRGSTEHRASLTPNTPSRRTSSMKNPSTPSRQLTPQVLLPSTPRQSSHQANEKSRSLSPKKLPRSGSLGFATDSKSPGQLHLFERNAKTGEPIPAFVLQPHEKRFSGLGIDKEGLGSPRVMAMLDKRRSIGEDAQAFILQEQSLKGVRFVNLLKIQEEEHREDGHIPPLQPSEKDATLNLKELISSLTPKKKVGNRKSLHVGAAKGLLGKRPIELDQDDDEEGNTSPKRLRGHEGSPVKTIRLPAPPSKDETVGRLTHSSVHRAVDSSPLGNNGSTPGRLNGFGDVKGSPAVKPGMLEPVSQANERKQEVLNTETRPKCIQLQDFLNITNIHFMELTTTKRRHTTAPGNDKKGLNDSGDESSEKTTIGLEDCVTAGFCVLPMLELYQHSCRELKSYISEGRRIIRSIEVETYTDNPPLFREYLNAPPDIRLLMDNQFRNIKTHARLLSKGMWYEWRMKLLEALKEGLDRHVEEMKSDDALLSGQEKILNDVVPGLVQKHSTLETEANKLQQMVDEMKNCDQDELRQAREKLARIDTEVAAKKKLLGQMQRDLQDKISTIDAGTQLKSEFISQIREAEQVKDECRGWSVMEVNTLKASTRVLESLSGWSIVSVTPSSGILAEPLLTMSYHGNLHVSFHPGRFRVPNSGVQFVPGTHTNTYVPPKLTCGTSMAASDQLAPIQSFILSSLRSSLERIQPSVITPKRLLRFLSEAWRVGLGVEEEIRVLEFYGVTKLKLTRKDSETSLRTRCIVLGNLISTEATTTVKKPKIRENIHDGRVDVDIVVTPYIRKTTTEDAGNIGNFELGIDVVVSKVYGFGTNNSDGMPESKMRDIIWKIVTENKSQFHSELGTGIWGKAVRELAGKVFS